MTYPQKSAEPKQIATFILPPPKKGHVKYCVETNNYLFNGHRSISNIK